MKTIRSAKVTHLLPTNHPFTPAPRWITVVGLAVLLASTQSAPGAAKLRWGFEPGRKYLYEVKIVATFPDEVETREGLSTLTVKSVADQQFTLGHGGNLATHRKPTGTGRALSRPNLFNYFPWPDNPVARPGDLTLSAQGRVIKSEVGTALPYMLGDLEVLSLEEFPAEAKAKWEQKNPVTITQRRRSRLPRGPFAPGDSPGVNRSAQEVINFAIIRSAGDNVHLKKEVLLRSDETVDGSPRFELTGDGELVFDLKQGVFQSQVMKYTFRCNETNLTLKVPVSVECRLLNAQETAQRLRAQEEARLAAQAAATKANEAKPLAPGEKEALSQDLKASNEWTVRNAADRLAKAPADNPPDEIAGALAALLADRNGRIRAAAAKALVNWGTTNSTSALIKAAAEEDLWVRQAAMEALGRLKSPAGAEAVAARLIPMQDRATAAKALRAMGPLAEPAVLPLLKDRDGWVRLEACKVLGEIGTAQSLPALEEFARNGRGFDQPEAAKASKAITARLQGK